MRGLTWPSLRNSEKTNLALFLLYSDDLCYCVRVPLFTFHLYKRGRTRARHVFSLHCEQVILRIFYN